MSRGPRQPKNLAEYTSADQAAAGLEQLAADLREKARAYPLVRWSINVSFWNPAWEQERPSMIKVGEHATNMAPEEG